MIVRKGFIPNSKSQRPVVQLQIPQVQSTQCENEDIYDATPPTSEMAILVSLCEKAREMQVFGDGDYLDLGSAENGEDIQIWDDVDRECVVGLVSNDLE
jgi:hypothetical protein